MQKGVDLSSTIYGYWLCLSVLLHAYILVGVDGWCSKQVADDYLDLVEEKLWHPRSPGLAAVAEVESQHRLRWVELTRGPEGMCLGEAIKASMSELAGAWQYGLSPGLLHRRPPKSLVWRRTMPFRNPKEGSPFVTLGTWESVKLTNVLMAACTFATSRGVTSRIGVWTMARVRTPSDLGWRQRRQLRLRGVRMMWMVLRPCLTSTPPPERRRLLSLPW